LNRRRRRWPIRNPAKLISPREFKSAKACGNYPVVLSPNGRIKPDLVFVNGKSEKHPEGAYYLEWREKGRRVRLSVNKDAQDG
jgi:hypothetical protein